MGGIPEDIIDAVKDRVDIVELVGRHIALKKSGRRHLGLCPFHSEKTPSFNVSPERGSYYCFGCGEGGNAFTFLMRQGGLTFPEAVRSLAAEVGIAVPERSGPPAESREPLYEAARAANAYYRRAFDSEAGAVARRYLEARGFALETADHYGIGYAPDRWEGLVSELSGRKLLEAGVRAGLVRERESGGHFDMLRNRLVFPIADVHGRVIAFGGRALAEGQEPKYLNTPESPIFRKREQFYGFPGALEAIRRTDRALVVEGYFDRIALDRAEIGEALATCGTALSEEHARALRRRTRNVVLLFDGDAAGRKAMLRSLELLLPQGLRVSAAALPAGEDPDDYLQKRGAEALRTLVDDAPDAIGLAIEQRLAAGVETPAQRADALAAVAPLLAAIPNPAERGEYERYLLSVLPGANMDEVRAATAYAAHHPEWPGARLPEQEDVAPKPQPFATDEDRHFGAALRLLIDNWDALAASHRGRLIELAPDGDWRYLAEQLTPQNRDALQGELAGLRAARFSAVINRPRPDLESDDAHMAGRLLEEELGWLGKRSELRKRQSLDREFQRPDADIDELLRRKQVQLEERRRKKHQRAQALRSSGP